VLDLKLVEKSVKNNKKITSATKETEKAVQEEAPLRGQMMCNSGASIAPCC